MPRGNDLKSGRHWMTDIHGMIRVRQGNTKYGILNSGFLMSEVSVVVLLRFERRRRGYRLAKHMLEFEQTLDDTIKGNLSQGANIRRKELSRGAYNDSISPRAAKPRVHWISLICTP